MYKFALIAILLMISVQSYKLTEFQNELEQQQSLQKAFENQIHNEQTDDGFKYDPEQGKMFAAFTQAAYCLNRKITKWKCGNPCKKYEGMSEIQVIESANKVNKGYIGYYEPEDAIVVVWKGTIKITQWLEDFDYFKTAYPYCDGCEVHKGFWQGWEGLQDYFWVAFNKMRQAHPQSQIWLSGHSLGAALSCFNALDFIHNGITDFVWYNFGQPRIGNQKVAEYLEDNLKKRLLRVTHHKDPVPHVPPEDFGFRHSTQEIFYEKKSGDLHEHIICSTTNGEDPKCSDKYKADLDVADHVFYEGWDYVYNIGKCII